MTEYDKALEARVKEQYERYPYPSYSLTDVPAPFVANSDSVDRISARFFGGKLDPATLNVLVAGGGTGEKTLGLALQLQPYGGTVTHLDLSASSIDVAKRGAASAKLENIRFVTGSIYDVAEIFAGERFDYIQAMGVLHHLPDPAAGLAALRDRLSDDGGMSIAVYGQTGRTAIYLMKEALLELIDRDAPMDEQLALAHKAFEALPSGHWLQHDQTNLSHIKRHGPKALLDSVLHSVDHAYTIDTFMAWIDGSGLRFLDFCEPWGKIVLDLPERLGFAPEVMARVRHMPPMRRRRFLELFDGRLIVHSAYVARSHVEKPRVTDDLSLIPSRTIGGTMRLHAADDDVLVVRDTRFGMVRFKLHPVLWRFLREIDGIRTTGEVLEAIIADEPDLDTTPQDLAARFGREGRVLFDLDVIVLNHRSFAEGAARFKEAYNAWKEMSGGAG